MDENAILNAQGSIASNQPNIISDIYTGNSGGTTTLAPQAAEVPGMGQAQDIASQMSNQLYGSGMVSGLETQRNAMMQELFDYDNQLDTLYSGQNQFPTYDWYVDNPADRVSSLAGIASATGGNIGRTAAAVDTTERAYNMAISNVLDRFMGFMEMQQQKEQFDRQMQLEEKKLMATLGGGEKDKKKQEAMQMLFGGMGQPQVDAQGNVVQASSAPQQQITWAQYQQALMHDPDNAALYTDLYQKFGQASGGMSDYQAIQMVSSMPGGYEALGIVPADQRGAYAKQIIQSGSASGLGVPLNLTSGQQERLTSLDAFENQLNQLEALYDQVSWKGPGLGTASSTLARGPLFKDVQQYENFKNAMAYTLGSALMGQSSVAMSDVDREIASSQLPDIQTDPTLAKSMFQQLREQANSTRLALGGGNRGFGAPLQTSTMANTAPQLPGNQALQTPQAPALAAPEEGEVLIPVEDFSSGIRTWIPEDDFDSSRHIRLQGD